ncbi:MAG: hypothetical protein MZV65_46410 [Chromatiales bacterium]|nr:hypothetical protein [Chromatiales bacterium]MCK7582306.1 hypothetical protein [Chromatiales bacterium]
MKNNVEELCRDLVRDLTEPALHSPFVPPRERNRLGKKYHLCTFRWNKNFIYYQPSCRPCNIICNFCFAINGWFFEKIPFIGENLAGAIGFVQILILVLAHLHCLR